MDGETNHANALRLERSLGRDEVHLFYPERHHLPFTYSGQVFLAEATRNEDDRPSRFTFVVSKWEAEAASDLATEMATHGEDDFLPDPEGRRILRQHVSYERSRKNRARAIELHGKACAACGFDFDTFYGAEFARGYIEVHHVRSITQADGPVDPRTDLVPLCSNCHSMAHRETGRIMAVEDIRSLIGKAIGTKNDGS